MTKFKTLLDLPSIFDEILINTFIAASFLSTTYRIQLDLQQLLKHYYFKYFTVAKSIT